MPICVTCLQEIEGGPFAIKPTEILPEGVTPPDITPVSVQNQLADCVPEFLLASISNALLCQPCVTAIDVAYKLRQTCLRANNKIQGYLQQEPAKSEVNIEDVVSYYTQLEMAATSANLSATDANSKGANKLSSIGRKKYRCWYPGCTSWYYTGIAPDYVNKHFFKSRKDPHYYQLWKTACNLEDTTKFFYICGDHFEDHSFVNSKKDRLTMFAVPIPVSLSADMQVNIIAATENERLLKEQNRALMHFKQASSCVSSKTLRTSNKTVDLDHNYYCLQTEDEII